MDVLCIGNATLDVFIDLKDGKEGFSFDKFSNQIAFRLGEKIRIDEYVFSLGGNSCNLAVGLSRLGVSSALASEVGSDEFSEKIVNALKREKVDISFLKKDGRTAPFFNILLSFMGERSILEEIKKDDSDIILPEFSSKMVYLSSMHGNWEGVYDKVLQTIGENTKLAFNPGSAQLENTEKLNEVLKKTNILFVNITEAQKVAKNQTYDIKALFSYIRELGPKVIVITDATNGSFACGADGKAYQIAPFSNKPSKERTGAGDSYASGFLYGLLSEKNIAESMRFGAINSDFVIQQIGAQKGLLSKDAMEKISNENPNFMATEI